ncbi:MAG: hypothetical protein ACXVIJ_09375 [Thermoanaerobaculia bacterium]
MEQGRDFLRHTLATLAYRAGKVVRDAPAGFESLRVAESVRTPAEILAHIGDLLDWGLAMASGRPAWRDSKPQPWDREVDRFFAALDALEKYLASDEPLGSPVEKLFQGPIADALTHTGQLALLRRMAGQPVRAENYFKADIAAGRVGREQSKPKVEF